MTTLEQTLVDLLKFGEPIGGLRKILEEAKHKEINFSFKKLMTLAKRFRTKGRMQQLLESLDEG